MTGSKFINRASNILLALAVIAVVISFLMPAKPYMDVQSLYDQAAKKGKVEATEIEAGWNKVCLVGPYCSLGQKELDPTTCNQFQDDGLWGLVFIKTKTIVSIKKYTRQVEFDGLGNPEKLKTMKSCFTIDEKPAFFVAGPKTLILKATRE